MIIAVLSLIWPRHPQLTNSLCLLGQATTILTDCGASGRCDQTLRAGFELHVLPSYVRQNRRAVYNRCGITECELTEERVRVLERRFRCSGYGMVGVLASLVHEHVAHERCCCTNLKTGSSAGLPRRMTRAEVGREERRKQSRRVGVPARCLALQATRTVCGVLEGLFRLQEW